MATHSLSNLNMHTTTPNTTTRTTDIIKGMHCQSKTHDCYTQTNKQTNCELDG